MHSLTNEIRPYAWGSTTAIPALLGTEATGGPEAEMWIGAHPQAPSIVAHPDGSTTGLDELIAADPEATLGTASRTLFGDRLPYLMKVLAAGAPLSLQVHPTLEQARAGYAAEQAAGVALDDPQRNYKDDNHKPEMILALSPFEALCGFRPVAQSAAVFTLLRDSLLAAHREVPPLLNQVLEQLRGAGLETEASATSDAAGSDDEVDSADEESALRAAFNTLISAGEDAASAVAAVVSVLKAGAPLSTETASYTTELSTVVSLANDYPTDPGVLISLLLNRVSLKAGETLYLPAGNIHAYLSGLGIEVMASSDNVLRGGLTPKYVDVPELLKTVDFRALPVPLLTPNETDLGQELYTPPFGEFQLQRITLAADSSPVPLAQHGPLLVLAISGAALLDSPTGDLVLSRGQSVFIPANEDPVMAHTYNSAPQSQELSTELTETVLFAVTVNGTEAGAGASG
ncbi:MAG: mannose-6-phosphate isomerase, class I, partial [Acidobacteria bacterium]|nr:mannose-6-phosphate isomerase, class I [Acidobacteriota bacterium]